MVINMNRSELRKKIMTILYQAFLYNSSNISYDIKDIIKENVEIENDFVNEIVNGVLEYKNDIDKIANKHLKDWNINRLGKIEQAILRMGIYELVYTDIPEIVAINESVELSKEYCDDKAKNIINAVLDSIYHEDEKDE